MTETLLPCPFCGEPAALKEDVRWHGAFRVECSNCDATVWATGEDNPASAIAAWNRRAPPAGVVVEFMRGGQDGFGETATLSIRGEMDWEMLTGCGAQDLNDALGLAPGECTQVTLVTKKTE